MNRGEPRLKDDVDAKITDDSHQYTLPFDQETAHSPFSAVGRAFRCLRPFAEKTTREDCTDALVYVRRRFERVFSNVYRDESVDDHLDHPTKRKIFEDMDLYRGGGIPPRTVTIEKTEETVELTYETGFHATEQTRYVEVNEESPRVGDELYYFGDGVKSIHAPYDPSPFESWRYRPSKLRVSFAGMTASDGLRIGVESTPPNPPLWYRAYLVFTQFGGPYAKDTLDLTEQTSTAKFVAERRREHIAEKS